MEVAKLSPSGAPTAIKSDEGNNPLSAFIHQTIGKGPMFSFSMTGDNPMQWIQMFNPLGQSDMLGWPMFTPLKIQLQKCEKCEKEFCSPINYRRHIRMHRRQSRSLNVDKESHKNIDLLGAFWDSLSLEDAKNVVSLDDISLKEVSGSSVVEKLTSALHKPGVWTMPQPYVMAGSVLSEIVQAKNTILPISSQELFNILDYASERTFLCAGTAESVLKFIIDGEPDEALEMRNLIASASILFEQKLVRAWLVDKEAEALRCQKLLEKEEEEAEKRRSQLLKRRKQKQLRQQAQKAREPLSLERTNNTADSDDKRINSFDGPSAAEISVSQENNQDTLVDMSSFPAQLSNEGIVEARMDLSTDHAIQCVDSPIQMENGHPQIMNDGWQVPKSRSQRSGRNGFYGSQNLRPPNFESFEKQALLKEKSEVNSGKVLPTKMNVETINENSGISLQEVETSNIDKSDPELLIGSISVPVSTSPEKNATHLAENTYSMDSASSKEDKFPEKNLDSNSAQEEIDQTTKVCSICPAERSVLLSRRSNQDTVSLGKVEDNSCGSREIHLQSSPTNTDNCGKIPHLERNDQLQGMLFSSNSAKPFLAKRWKETISGDHIKLVLSPDAPGNPDNQNDCSSVGVSSLGVPKHQGLTEAMAQISPIDKNTRAMSKKKPEKGTSCNKKVVT